MKKRTTLILAIIILIGAIAFGIVGFIQWNAMPKTTEITSYGMMPFHVSSFGYGTAYNSEDDKNSDTVLLQYVEYRNEDGRFSFIQEVSNEEYMDLQIARENQAELRTVRRYVYTYLLNGELQVIIQEQELSDNQLREIIGNTNRASMLQYLLFAGLLLITGVYFLVTSIKKSKVPNKSSLLSDDEENSTETKARSVK